MSAQHRDALMAHILSTHASVVGRPMGNMVLGLSLALGKTAMSAEHRNALMTQIIGAHSEISGEQMRELIWALGKALGGPVMTAAHRDALMNMILSSYASCGAESMGDMVCGLRRALGGQAMSVAHRHGLMQQILGAHRTCSTTQIATTYSQVCSGVNIHQLLNDHLQSGLSPIKIGKLVGASVAVSCTTLEQKELCRAILYNSFMTYRLPQAHAGFVNAGFMAACGDLSSILAQEGLEDGEKLNFIDFACGVVSPLDLSITPFQLGKIMFLEQPNKLKAQTLATLLSHAPYNPSWFASVRNWLIGELAELPNIRWVRSKGGSKEEMSVDSDSAESAKEEVTVECDCAAFADWYGCIKELYHGVAKHMTGKCIENEKRVISKHPMLPSDVQKTILDVLNSREAELTVTL